MSTSKDKVDPVDFDILPKEPFGGHRLRDFLADHPVRCSVPEDARSSAIEEALFFFIEIRGVGLDQILTPADVRKLKPSAVLQLLEVRLFKAYPKLPNLGVFAFWRSKAIWGLLRDFIPLANVESLRERLSSYLTELYASLPDVDAERLRQRLLLLEFPQRTASLPEEPQAARRGRKVKVLHEKIIEIAQSVQGRWQHHLGETKAALDAAGVPIPKPWRKQHSAENWADMTTASENALVKKAIQGSFRWAAKQCDRRVSIG